MSTDGLLLSSTGNLHFSYLTMSDEQGGRLYKCNVFNPQLDTTRGGSYTRLHITPGTASAVLVLSALRRMCECVLREKVNS